MNQGLQPTTLTPFTQGDTPLFQFPVTVGGLAENFDGFEGLFTITSQQNPTTDSGAQVSLDDTLTSDTNVFSFQTILSQTQASSMSADTYNWSFRVKDPTATYYTTVAYGTVEVLQAYTTRSS